MLNRLTAWFSRLSVEKVLLVLVLLFALGVRLHGIDFGLPYTIHPDEPNVVDRAVITMKTGDWNPHWFIYPSGYHYLQTGVMSLHLLWGITAGIYNSPADLPDSSHTITAAPAAYLWARGTTALFGVLTVYLAYLIGRRLYDSGAGFAAALLVALSPLHVEHSHYVTTDVPTAALCLLAMFLALQLLDQKEAARPGSVRGLAFLSGLVAGFAGGFKYNGVVVLLPLLAAIAMRTVRLGPPEEGLLSAIGRFFSPILGLTLVGVVVGYTLACPFTFADLPVFLDDLGYETHIYRFGGDEGVVRVYQVGDRFLPPWQAYAHALFKENPLAALAFLGGTIYALFRRRREDILLLLFAWGYYFFLSSYGSIFVRNVLVALPGLAVLGGVFLSASVGWLVRRSRWRLWEGRYQSLLLALLLVAIFVAPTRRLFIANIYRATSPSQRLARQWLDENVAPGEKIAAELHPVLFTGAAYPVTKVDYLSNYPLHLFVNRGYRYIVANSEYYGPEFAEQDTLPEHYAKLLDRLEPVADFAGHTQDLPGPRLTIYRVPQGALMMQYPSQVTTEPGLRLLGFDLGQRRGQGDLAYVSEQTTFQPGDIIALTLYLDTIDDLPEDYFVSVRLRNTEGRTVAWQEQPPCAGNCPTTRWISGEVVVEQVDLPTSPVLLEGTYQLELQFLRAVDKTPLPTVPPGQEGIILLTEVTVQEESP
jgi:4-amino-4-deoxy-L-arabinose transferase-like glycosyltransferase